MTMPTLLYCSDGNQRFAQIAVGAGFGYGARSGTTYYLPPAFLDLDHRRPDFARHLAEVARVRPRFAVAGDATTDAELDTVLEQAAQLRPHADHVLVVPKQPGMVARIPPEYVVGLSVPTRFGSTQAPFWEFAGRRVHLLGGSPQAQMRLWRYLSAEVVSVDGNSHRKASLWGTFWTRRGWVSHDEARRRWTATTDIPYAAFAESCRNITAAWAALTGGSDG